MLLWASDEVRYYLTSASIAQWLCKLARASSLARAFEFTTTTLQIFSAHLRVDQPDSAWCEAKIWLSFGKAVSIGKRIVTMLLHVLAWMACKAGWKCDVSGGGLPG